MKLQILAAILALLVVSSAPAAAREADHGFGGITGTITALGDSEVLIEENPGERSGSDKSYVRLVAETRVWIETRGGRAAAGFEDLAVGQRAKATFSGPVAESYPSQATAASITVLEDEGAPDLPGTGGPNLSVLGLVAVVLAGGLYARKVVARGLRPRVLE